MTSYRVFAVLAMVLAAAQMGCGSKAPGPKPQAPAALPRPGHSPDTAVGNRKRVEMSDAEWRAKLTPEQYRIMREKGTERPFTGKYWNTKTPGTYKCAGCGQTLFTSKTKFDSGCGWPSFFASVADENVDTAPDESLGMVRTEILCSGCGSHLGHVFPDGPEPTGLRYCVNSASLDLEAAED